MSENGGGQRFPKKQRKDGVSVKHLLLIPSSDFFPMNAAPTTEQLEQSVSVICKVIGQIPAFHIYEEYVAHRFATGETETSLRAMTHNAALDSTLINLRCFNEFFRPGGRPDDIRAYHFPGVSLQPFLSPTTDAQSIDKYLAHITKIRSDIVTKPWLIDDMVILGLQHGVEFLNFVETSFPLHDDATRSELRSVREVVRRLIPKITKLPAMETETRP